MTGRKLHLTGPARADIADILSHSGVRFGRTARARYGRLIAQALLDLRMDPMRPTSADRSEFAEGLRSYHLAQARSRAPGVVRPRHVVIYRCPTELEVRVVRILHDVMELPLHLPPIR